MKSNDCCVSRKILLPAVTYFLAGYCVPVHSNWHPPLRISITAQFIVGFSGIVPISWHTAIVTPVPKVSAPASLNDYQPISVTPVLCRIAEKYIVKHFIRPAIPLDAILDQFAFKPSGSTTFALVSLQHHVTDLLETRSYVRCLIIDFSKVFDTTDHSVLLSKFSSFGLPANILNWITDFLTDRQQICKLGSLLSHPVSINTL